MHGTLKYCYARMYFKRPGPLLLFRQTQLERSLEYLFAMSDPAIGVELIDVRTLQMHANAAWQVVQGIIDEVDGHP